MSGGEMRKHNSCKKSKKWDVNAPICKVCGYRVFYEDDRQRKLFINTKEGCGELFEQEDDVGMTKCQGRTLCKKCVKTKNGEGCGKQIMDSTLNCGDGKEDNALVLCSECAKKNPEFAKSRGNE